MIFYKELQCYLPNNLDDLNNNLYPCIGLRSQDASDEANFGRKKFKYLSKFLFNIKFWYIIL
ncbi:hypothetical protein C2G38_2114524 [Gigaspora rosea]|uniref:Uncharacterized protein n=1 Tax=Gigaspora rosea TaxID=44941 RepID=A0A397UJ31_9GLOM|nr:hypothetical protein C2G38_2114524 [Gigaspora rosea]